MADTYKKSFSSGHKVKRSRGASFWLTVADIMVYPLMALLFAATFVCLLTPYVMPATLGWLSVIALGAPIIFLLDIVVMFYWVIRWRWWHVAISGIVVVVGLFYLPRYYQIEPSQERNEKIVERRFIKVTSYNVANGNNEALVDSIERLSPAILCVQEYLSDGRNKWSRLSPRYSSTLSTHNDFSCEILTRYKIIRHGEIDSLTRYNAVWAGLRLNDDTVRVINTHLHSTSIRKDDSPFIQQHQYIYDTERDAKLRSIVTRLRDNNINRSRQVDIIRAFIDRSPVEKVIVCGDFNDIPLSYTYSTLADGMLDTFREAGRGYTYTFDGFFRLMRIDYILCSPQFEVTTYDVDSGWKFSDHYPVTVRLKLETTK
jgi:endonuclease/exonuclease/phosphatase family metal-dependent hydrolase